MTEQERTELHRTTPNQARKDSWVSVVKWVRVSWRALFIVCDRRATLLPLLQADRPLDPRCYFKPPPN